MKTKTILILAVIALAIWYAKKNYTLVKVLQADGSSKWTVAKIDPSGKIVATPAVNLNAYDSPVTPAQEFPANVNDPSQMTGTKYADMPTYTA